MKGEMIEFLHKERGYTKRFLRTRTEEELENHIVNLGLIEQYGDKDTNRLLDALKR